jgi:hypothetical protein
LSERATRNRPQLPGPRRRAPGSRLARFAAIAVSAVAWLFLAAPGAASADAEHDYVGARKCRSCHRKEPIGNQYGVWEESRHAKAFETLAGDKAAEWASEAGVDDPQNDERCVKCHVTAYGVEEDRLSRKFKRELGVQCEACHGPGKDYAKKKVMIDPDLAREKGLVSQSEEVCVACHNHDSPAWDPERYTLADGTKVGFDYDLALEEIAHPVPEDYDPSSEGEAD